jgi:universal stress protein A
VKFEKPAPAREISHGWAAGLSGFRRISRVGKRILVPTDFSPSSMRALDYAATLAGCLDASIDLIHVRQDPLAAKGAWEFYLPESEDVRERMYQEARAKLSAMAASFLDAGVRITIEVRTGSPTDEINAAAVARGSELIVMGTHGRTGLSHLLLGSIAERTLRTAPCPVLAVREALVEVAGTEKAAELAHA